MALRLRTGSLYGLSLGGGCRRQIGLHAASRYLRERAGSRPSCPELPRDRLCTMDEVVQFGLQTMRPLTFTDGVVLMIIRTSVDLVPQLVVLYVVCAGSMRFS